MNDLAHPLWSFLRFLVIAVITWSALKYNASNFDATEIRSLLIILMGAGSIEGVGQIVRRYAPPKS